MLFLFGLAPVLYGVAILAGDVYRPWLGWVGIIFGLVSVSAAVIQLLTGNTTLPFYILFPVAAFAITLWITCLGFLMWRNSAELTPR